MRDDCESKQPDGVSFDIVCMVIAFRYKIPKDGRCQPANDMQGNDPPIRWIVWLKHTR